MDNEKEFKNTIQSAERVLQILEEFVCHGDELRIKDLTQKFGLSKGTIHRFLATLESQGYITQEKEHGAYRLTLKLFQMGSRIISSINLSSLSYPILKELSERTGETVHQVVLDRYEAVFINKIENQRNLVNYSSIGRTAPVHCIASGKLLLAYLPEAEAMKIIERKGLARYTENTLTEPEVLLEDLRLIRQRGYSLDHEEYEQGVSCVAAPVWDHRDQVVAAVSVSTLTVRIPEERWPGLIEAVKDAGSKISRALGYQC